LDGLQFRTACQICEQPLPEGEHMALTIGLVGVEAGKLYIKARDDLARRWAWPRVTCLQVGPKPLTS